MARSRAGYGAPMVRAGEMAGLENGAQFPSLSMAVVGGGELALPDQLAGSFGVVLAYRGSWCPYCNAQLASFERRLDKLTEAGIGVVAFSADDEEHATETVTRHGITFPVGFGVDAEKVAELLGGYINRGRGALESTNFLLRPDGTIEVAVYSSKVLGRLVPDDVLGYVAHLRAR